MSIVSPSSVIGADGPETMAYDCEPFQVPDPTPLPPLSASPVLRVDGYDILERLGVGGMGVVFKARHRQLNRVVALKMLGRDSLADPESHRRFQAEAEAVARLQHPNIIQVFDVGTFAGRADDPRPCPYLSLEYVDGGSLYKLTLAPQDPRYAAQLVEKAARAVHAAHRVGVIHRDLKPANVLLTGEGEPKIADFGLAKQTEPPKDDRGRYATQAGTTIGTPEYMSPEQVDGLPATPSFDVYALGVILYELLTARLPFQGLTLTETMLLVKYQEPVSPSRLRPSLPRDLETICLKCMAKAAGGRYATAEELADDLRRYLDGRAILARPVSRVERLGRWAKRNPLAAGLAAVAVAVAVVGVSGVTWKWRDAEWHARQAELQARKAEERRQAERWELYRASVAIAAADLRMNTLNSTLNSLDRAPEEHRNWEWWHYRNQLNVSREVYPVAGGTVRASFTVAPGRVVISQDDRVRLWDVDERREVFVSTGGEHHGWNPLADGRRFTFSRDGRVVIRSVGGETPDLVLSDPDAPLDLYARSADGRRVLTVGGRRVRVWDTATGEPLSPARRTAFALGTAALSTDGGMAATYLIESGDLEVWDTATGETRFTVPGLRDLYWVRFSPDGTRVTVNEAFPSCKVRQWDTRTGRPAGEFAGHINNVLEMAYSPDGAVAATGSRDLSVRLWEAATGRERAVLRGHTGMVNAVAFSPDGKRVVSAAGDLTVRIWDVNTGAELTALRGHTGEVLTVGFVDAGTVVSAARDGTVRVWDVRPATAGGVWTGHEDKGYVYQVAYHPDGEHVLSASWDGTARIWDDSGREVGRLDHGRAVNVVSVAVHPAGRLVATLGKNDQLWVWDFLTRKVLHTTQGTGSHWMTPRLAFSPDGKCLAVGGCAHGEVRLFDPDGLTQVAVLPGPAHCVGDVAFSPDGKCLAVGNSCGMLRVWDVARREVVAELHGHTDEVRALAFSHDGKRLASGSADGTVKLWATTGWEQEGELKYGVRVYGLAFTPDDSRLACGCADSTIRLCDPARREVVAELHGHKDFVHAVVFSPDGHRLVSGSGDLTLRTWDARPPD